MHVTCAAQRRVTEGHAFVTLGRISLDFSLVLHHRGFKGLRFVLYRSIALGDMRRELIVHAARAARAPAPRLDSTPRYATSPSRPPRCARYAQRGRMPRARAGLAHGRKRSGAHQLAARRRQRHPRRRPRPGHGRHPSRPARLTDRLPSAFVRCNGCGAHTEALQRPKTPRDSLAGKVLGVSNSERPSHPIQRHPRARPRPQRAGCPGEV